MKFKDLLYQDKVVLPGTSEPPIYYFVSNEFYDGAVNVLFALTKGLPPLGERDDSNPIFRAFREANARLDRTPKIAKGYSDDGYLVKAFQDFEDKLTRQNSSARKGSAERVAQNFISKTPTTRASVPLNIIIKKDNKRVDVRLLVNNQLAQTADYLVCHYERFQKLFEAERKAMKDLFDSAPIGENGRKSELGVQKYQQAKESATTPDEKEFMLKYKEYEKNFANLMEELNPDVNASTRAICKTLGIMFTGSATPEAMRAAQGRG